MDKNEKVAIASHYAIMSLAHLELMPLLEESNIHTIILQICQTISTTLNEGRLVRGTIIIHLFYTLVEIMVSLPKGILEQPQICQALFDAITAGLVAKSKGDEDPAAKDRKSTRLGTPLSKAKTVSLIKDENAKNIAEAAEVLLAFTLNQLCNFPVPVGPSVMSSAETELRYLQESSGLINPDPRIHHFIFNNYSLVTIMESPDAAETARIILRDMTGKYCWDYKLSLTESNSLFKKVSKSTTLVQELPTLESSKEEEQQKEEQQEKVEEQQQQVEEQQQQQAEQEEQQVEEQHGADGDEDDGILDLTPSAELHQQHDEPLPVLQSLQSTVDDNDTYAVGYDDDDGLLDITPAMEHDNLHASHNQEIESRSHVDLQADDDIHQENEVQAAQDQNLADQSEREENYPKYDAMIDTDKTDMLEVLQHYVAQAFADCAEYAVPSVNKIEQQNINFPPVEKAIVEQLNSERALLESTAKRPFSIVDRPPKQESEIYRVFRAFLNNMGFLSPINRISLNRIDANHKFFRTLKQLDKTPERETMKIGVIYVKNKQEKEKVIMKNNDGSPLYSEFLQSLGWDIDLRTHQGFIGGLDNSDALATGSFAPYYSNPTIECVFHVVTNMPTKENDSQQIHKKRHVGNDFVHIVWSEHDRDYRPWTIVSQFNNVHIVIYPLKDPFFRIQIFTKPDVALFGPLLDGMVVDKQHLGTLVRLTAINANKAVRYAQQGYKKPYPTRRDMLNEICERFKKQTSNEEFLRPLFFDQLGKLQAVTSVQKEEPTPVDEPLTQPETPIAD